MNQDPFRHAVIDDLLPGGLPDRLLLQWPDFYSGRYIGDNGLPGLKSVHEDLAGLGGAFLELKELLSSLDFRARLLESLEIHLPAERSLFDDSFFGGGCHENVSGQWLDQHVDFNQHPARPWVRHVNLILSLNPVWLPEWGGCLELHRCPDRPQEDFWTTIVPAWNRGVIFEAGEQSWHGFRAIMPDRNGLPKSRKTIACYYYLAGTTQDPHSTIYLR